MPYKHETDKMRIPRKKGLDKRIKLTPEQREEIRDNVLGLSLNALASQYKVSKRTVHFIICPEKYELMLKQRKERGGSKQYYDKDKHKESMKAHRTYKTQLHKQNKLEKRDQYEKEI